MESTELLLENYKGLLQSLLAPLSVCHYVHLLHFTGLWMALLMRFTAVSLSPSTNSCWVFLDPSGTSQIVP